MSESEKGEGFKVFDKRKFTSEGESRDDSGDGRTQSLPENSAPQTAEQFSASSSPTGSSRPAPEQFQMTFETLVLSLSSTAMVQLGVIADPLDNAVSTNLPAARQTIDILEILQQKTVGNLSDSEKKLLDNILYELRMAYVESTPTLDVPR